MSLIGALSISTQAMMAQSHGMQTVSGNIANVSTTGYKREDTQFSTLLNGTVAKGSPTLGVRPYDRRNVVAQGIIGTTGRSDDLAINGRGFFVVSRDFTNSDSEGISYTRDGALKQKYVDIGNGIKESYYTTANGGYLMGWAANADGSFTTTDSLESLVPIRSFALDELVGTASTTALMSANVPAQTLTGETTAVHGKVYDTSFNAQSLDYIWTKTGANAWTVEFDVSNGAVSAPLANATEVNFLGNGKVASPQEPVPISVTWDDGTTSEISVDISEMEQYSGPNQVYRTEQDGSETGRLYDENFDENGVLWGSYTNGHNRALYKTAVARFVAPDNLETQSGNVFKATVDAGKITINDLESEARDTNIQAGNLEKSNVDIADEFTKMIVVQKAYSMASKNYQTVDEMMEVATTLKR